MGKKRFVGDDEDLLLLLLPEDVLIEFLVRLPPVSLLRFKVVCKSWLALIESSSFTDLYSNSSSSSSSSSSNSNKFGSFILHAAVDSENFREDAVFMLSSVSESESRSESSARYTSFGLWSTGFYGICSECDSLPGDSGSGGWRWSDEDGLCCCLCEKLNNISGEGELSTDDQQQLVLKLVNLGFPSCYSFSKPHPPKVMVVGSCNGLICLYDEQSNDVSFWNPATSNFRILPKSSSITIAALSAAGDGDVHRLFAFGFDDKTKDYKVVLLSVSNRRMLDFVIKDEPAAPLKCVCRVEVYSSSTNSWKLLEGITCLPGSPFPYPPDSSSSSSSSSSGLFYLNGSCFFMAKLLYSSSSSEEEEQCIPPPKCDDRFMISLDLTKEIITPIQLPRHHHHYRTHLYLCYLGKKIACFAKYFCYTNPFDVNDPNGSWEGFYISAFNEHTSSWTLLHWFRIRLGLPGERYIPKGISNDGVFALLETEILGGLGNKKKMKLHNLVTNKKVNTNFLSSDQVLSKAFPYEPIPSSFSLQSSRCSSSSS